MRNISYVLLAVFLLPFFLVGQQDASKRIKTKVIQVTQKL